MNHFKAALIRYAIFMGTEAPAIPLQLNQWGFRGIDVFDPVHNHTRRLGLDSWNTVTFASDGVSLDFAVRDTTVSLMDSLISMCESISIIRTPNGSFELITDRLWTSFATQCQYGSTIYTPIANWGFGYQMFGINQAFPALQFVLFIALHRTDHVAEIPTP